MQEGRMKRGYMYMMYMFRNQTMCEKVMYNNMINSQMTKARNMMCSFSNYTFNSFFTYGQYMNLYNLLSVKWKMFIKSKLVGISEAMRLMFIEIYSYLFLYTNYLDLLIYNNNTSTFNKMNSNPPFDNVEGEGHNQVMFFKSYKQEDIDDMMEEEYKEMEKEFEEMGNDNNVSTDPFHEWLAGVMDGDGYFNLSKSGTARLNMVMDMKDKSLLYEMKHKFGGSIHSIANANALKYQLNHKKGLINMMNAMNGNMRNPKRMLQMNKLCIKYNMNLLFPKPLTFYNGWYSGFIDSDGSMYINVKSDQMFLTVCQKDKYMLEPLQEMFGGRTRTMGSKKMNAFTHQMYRKNELMNLMDNYFNLYPTKSEKKERLLLMKDFYLLRTDRESKDMIKLNKWLEFKNKWDKFGQ
ncbi:putative intron-encoded endonuclease (mitochondrion) [[Candida] railenensis]|uniref:putative intron-encoded endonuclease n=1 Tax=[Candida] railenensis TaxID=45579 RepID=UPI002028180C|nr:putative intron-encoded endonuclease [[Candida] railenensis]CAH2356110.1 putative intron-encoded endonuclease [[Candida] railenensis]